MPEDTPPNGQALLEYRVAQIEKTNGELRQHVAELEIKMENRERERARQERALLVRGISFLGFVITVLVGTIWAYRGVIFQGRGP